MLVIDGGFDRQHVETVIRAEGNLARAYFESAVECDRFEWSTFVSKTHEAHRGRRRLQRHAQQLQKLAPVSLRDLVRAIQQIFREKREQLEQGDARVALVEIRPLRIVNGNARQRFVQQILVATIIDGWNL